MKNTEKDIQIAEGLAQGKTHTGKSTAMNPTFGGAGGMVPANNTKKSHEGDVKRGEGLAMGKTIGGKSHESVKDSGKFAPEHAKKAMRLNVRSQEGNADPCGGWDCSE